MYKRQAPIGAFAGMNDQNEIRVKGMRGSLDGTKFIEIGKIFEYRDHVNYGEKLAQEIMKNGGEELMQQIKNSL